MITSRVNPNNIRVGDICTCTKSRFKTSRGWILKYIGEVEVLKILDRKKFYGGSKLRVKVKLLSGSFSKLDSFGKVYTTELTTSYIYADSLSPIDENDSSRNRELYFSLSNGPYI